MSKPNPKPPEPKPGVAPGPAAGEAEYLAQQALDAKAAISRSLAQIGTDLGQSVSPATWTRTHPWLTLGASTIAGFVATAAVVPSKEQQALRKLAKIEESLRPKPEPKHREEVPADGAKGYRTGRTSFARSVLGEVIKAVQPALLSMLTAGVTASAARPSQEEMQAAAAAEDSPTPATPAASTADVP